MLLLAIFAGGALGAVARHAGTAWIYRRTGHGFPWGTLAVNMSGSFLVGLLLPLLQPDHALASAFVTVGFIGAFTTFSTFAWEAVTLARSATMLRAGVYVAVSLCLGLASVALGYTAALRLP